MKKYYIATEMSGLDIAKEFAVAWRKMVDDFEKKIINSERCLQAAIYAHLRRRLEKNDDLAIYVEPPIRLLIDSEKQDRKYIDLVVVNRVERQILFAAELKYTPNGTPRPDSIKADIEKLSFVKNHKNKSKKVSVSIRRYLRSPESGKEEIFSVAPGCIVAFAVVAREGRFSVPTNESNKALAFWRAYGKSFGKGSVWNGKAGFPRKRLMVCSALTAVEKNVATVECCCYGAGQD